MAKRYYVYIAANASRTLYVGVTNDLSRRAAEHQAKTYGGFTARYNVDEIVYFRARPPTCVKPSHGKSRSRGGARRKKIALVEIVSTPGWADLSKGGVGGLKPPRTTDVLPERCFDFAQHDQGTAQHDKGTAQHDKAGGSGSLYMTWRRLFVIPSGAEESLRGAAHLCRDVLPERCFDFAQHDKAGKAPAPLNMTRRSLFVIPSAAEESLRGRGALTDVLPERCFGFALQDKAGGSGSAQHDKAPLICHSERSRGISQEARRTHGRSPREMFRLRST